MVSLDKDSIMKGRRYISLWTFYNEQSYPPSTIPHSWQQNPLWPSMLPLSHRNESDGRDLSERAISPSPPSYGCALAGGAHARLATPKR